MLKITDDNYGDYKQVFGILWKFNAKVNKLDPNSEESPLILLNNWEKKNKSIAKRGLKAGLIDVISMSINLSIDMKKDINYQLTTQGFTGFNQLVSIVKDTLQKVLKRDKIRTLDEYYILKELLDDSTYEISEAHKKQIERILRDFEINCSKKR